jgi:signal transduction histidine kinase
MKLWLPRLVARVPAGVHAKLLVAFLAIVFLLIAVGAAGLQVLSQTNHRTNNLVELQRKIAAYRQLQYDTEAQLHTVASALLVGDEQTLNATLRQLNQFGYDYDRLQFVAKDEAKLLDEVRKDYEQFTHIVTKVVELIRVGKTAEGRELQLAQASPIADRLELITNQLVNEAEADMVASVDASDAAYLTSRWIVIGFALGSIGLALVLGYAFSWSLIGPVKQMDLRLKQIALGDFSRRVEVLNRDELGTLAANVNRMNDELGQLYRRLETANRHKSQFLASVNHELRTPVSAIIGYARLILRGTEGQITPLQKENLQDLLNNAERLLTQIDSLLDFATIEAGKIELQSELVGVGELVQSTAATIESILNKDSVRLVCEISSDNTVLYTDREKLRQIMLNLLSNAVKFTDRGEIKISTRQENDDFKLTVADTGIGIDGADINKIFEEFNRGRLSNEACYRGTGLGLTIVKRLVDILGGSIVVESQLKKGSTFTVTLPMKARNTHLI